MQTQNCETTIYSNKHLVFFCIVFVFIYASTKLWIGSKIASVFEALFIIPFYIMVIKNWSYFKKIKLTWIVLATLITPILQFLLLYIENSEQALTYQGIDKLFKLTFFLASAFWLSHHPKWINTFIALNLISVLVLTLTQSNFEERFLLGLQGYRVQFGNVNPAFMAMFAGISTISCFSLLSQTKKIKQPYLKTMFTLSLAVLTIFSLFLLYCSQTRAAYLGLLTSILFITCLIVIARIKSHSKINLNPALLVLIVVCSIISIALISQTKMAAKSLKEATSIYNYITNPDAPPPNDNSGYRIQLWKISLEETLKKPLTGHGGESRKELITHTEGVHPTIKKHMHHFHNSWMEFSAAYGLPGAALLTLLLGYITYQIIQSWIIKQKLKNHIAIYSLASLIFISTMNLFESYFFFWQGVHTLIWTLTPALAAINAHKVAFTKMLRQ